MDIIKNIINFIKKYIKIIVNFIKNVFDKKKAFLLLGIVSLLVVIFAISSSFAVAVPVESITFTSNDLNYENKEAGAWQVVKSARWVSKGKAQITFAVDSIKASDQKKSTDYILVVDSTLLDGKDDFSTTLNNMIQNMFVGRNRVSLIGFYKEAFGLGWFTSNANDVISALNEFSTYEEPKGDVTSYYRALQMINNSLESSYDYPQNTNLEVIFITDGKPLVDVSLNSVEYKLMKEKYSSTNIKVKAIQYEMGATVADEIKNISDEQIVVNKDNAADILGSLYFGGEYYEKFLLGDTVSAPFVIDNIDVSVGNVQVSDGFVTWDLSNSIFGAGGKATMKIDVSADNGLELGKFFLMSEVGSKVAYVFKRNSDIVETVSTDKTPVLASSFSVSYDSNAPKDCVVSNMPDASNVLIYDIVRPSSKVPICSGYKFKGWKVVTDGVKVNNDGTFIMPYKAVTLKATWSKTSLNITTDGTLASRGTLYSVLEKEATSGGLAKEYTGQHQDDINGTGTSKIYHYYASSTANGTKILDKNNVVFAGICWQMIRTTDTGGVKMIYNGEVSSDGTCGTNRAAHIGYSDVIEMPFDGSKKFYFGTNYTYNKTTGNFTLSESVNPGVWQIINNFKPVGKYTCFSSSSTSCSTLYYVLGQKDSSATAIVAKISATVNYSTIGDVPFNSDFDVGYMYNDSYLTNYFKFAKREIKKDTFTNINAALSTTLLFSDAGYTSGNDSIPLYYIGGSSIEEINDSLIGYYFFPDGLGTYETARYIVKADLSSDGDLQNGTSTYYYIELKNGDLMNGDYYIYGDKYEINNDNTYTIVNPQLITRKEFYANYGYYANKYYCEDSNYELSISHSESEKDDYIQNEMKNNKCVDLYVDLSSNENEVTPDNYDRYFSSSSFSSTYKFAKGFTYSNGKYKLDADYVNLYDANTFNVDYRYTCLAKGDSCDSIYYVYYSRNPYDNLFYYIELSNGKDISALLTDLFNSDNANTNDSKIKTIIDSWYSKKLSTYVSYLESTIFCNNRTIKSLGGFDPSVSGSISNPLEFGTNSSLLCSSIYDSFSTDNNKAKLQYPIGLLTKAEAELINVSKGIVSGSLYWLLSPYAIYGYNSNYYVSHSGSIGYNIVKSSYGVRPVITLKGSLKYTTGDGSMNNPYVIETE